MANEWVFVDDDGERFDLTQDEYDEAIGLGEFYHPWSGRRVYNFERKISPYTKLYLKPEKSDG